MNKKQWLIDISLIVIIIVMGVFVVIELNRTYDFIRQRSNASPTEPVDVVIESNQTEDLLELIIDEPLQVDENGLNLMNLDGETLALSDFQGTPLLINFWATWCPPCLEEMPLLQAYADRYQGDLAVLAINAGEDALVVRDFVAQQELTLTILLDPTGAAINQYRVYGFPTTLFFDADGDLRSTHIGELNDDLIDEYLLTIGIGE